MPATKTRKTSSARRKNSNSLEVAVINSQLEKLFGDALKDLYWAEKHLVKELPKMSKAATTQELKDAIDEHKTQTEEHVARLEQVFELMGKKAQAKKCDGMEGLLKEGTSILEETDAGTMTRDAGIIMASQKVEHYEISAYGTLASLAQTMGKTDIAEILNTTLEEEKEADSLLSGIAENNINWEAEQEPAEKES
ncbi:ferritin-like domain-containing protein [Lacibacter sp. H375]|uniref:YciE/YciF ferroxidase family protein n=1 Tax=Lacibacter sp. H375 TaxID=3133424 RepID=UPI0030BC0EAE